MKDYKELQNGSDIRGVAMEGIEGQKVNLTRDAAQDLAAAFALWLGKKLDKAPSELVIAIGRDSRLSGPVLEEVCCKSLAAIGTIVYDCGLASTPAMFMSTVFPEMKADGAIMLTASHLPFNRNGMKFFTEDGGLDKGDIKALIAIAGEYEAPKAPVINKETACSPDCGRHLKGAILPYDLMKLYCAHLRAVICRGLAAEEKDLPLKGLRVVCDAGNGGGGFYVSSVLEPLGADCSGSVFLEPDGSFPNHQPNPENKEAMDAVCSASLKAGADLGIIFDTDVDRAAAVDSKGHPIARNGIVALAAVLAAEGHPGTTVVTDSITSNQLGAFLTGPLGLDHLRFKRGYKNVINKAIELNRAGTDCQLAIETSGHAALKENYFLDDGAYLATRIVIKAAQLKKAGRTIESLMAEMEEPLEAEEFRLAVNAEDFASYAGSVLKELESLVASGACPGMTLEKPNYEGVRVNVDHDGGDGWFLIRKSLHDPLMPVNIESNMSGGVEKIAKKLKSILASYSQLDISKL